MCLENLGFLQHQVPFRLGLAQGQDFRDPDPLDAVPVDGASQRREASLLGVEEVRWCRRIPFQKCFPTQIVAVRAGCFQLLLVHLLSTNLLLALLDSLIQLFVGRRALALSALAAGVGVGLFIDEVGKFITTSNDYFFAPAAPIIVLTLGGMLLVAAAIGTVWGRRRGAAGEGNS